MIYKSIDTILDSRAGVKPNPLIGRYWIVFGNIDFSFTETLKLSLGFRREDWKANYNDSFGERFSPSNMMNGGKLSLIKSTKNTTIIYLLNDSARRIPVYLRVQSLIAGA